MQVAAEHLARALPSISLSRRYCPRRTAQQGTDSIQQRFIQLGSSPAFLADPSSPSCVLSLCAHRCIHPSSLRPRSWLAVHLSSLPPHCAHHLSLLHLLLQALVARHARRIDVLPQFLQDLDINPVLFA